MGAQCLEWAVAEPAAVAEPLVVDPVDGLLLPLQCERPQAGPPEVAHRTVRLRDLPHLVPRQSGGLVEAGGIGEQRPDLLHRAVELPYPSSVFDRVHSLWGYREKRYS